MAKFTFMNKINGSLRRTGLQIKKHAPEIMVVTGVVGTVASTVLACRATTKVLPVIKEAREDLDTLEAAIENPELLEKKNITVEDCKSDMRIVYAKTGLQIAKEYAPAVILGALSITCILTSHKMLRKRNMTLAAAYVAEHAGFKKYRDRVIERFGEELDHELKYNIKKQEIEKVVVNEDGTETVITENVDVVDPTQFSPFSIIFDDGNKGWEKDAEHNKFFLIQTQNYANDLLKARAAADPNHRGHVFLNEVYDMLGVRHTKAGAVFGWIYDEECPVGDNFIDFGLFDIHNPQKRDFVNGYEKSVVIDFNVDGPILDLI